MTKPPNDDRMMRALTPVKPAVSTASSVLRKVYDDAEANRVEELDGSIMTLNVEDVHTYDKDVRVGPNPKYEEIKASLISQGNNHRFSVTRRPGDSRYFVSAGANTRLRIIKDLWRQTQDKRWKTVDVVYRVWRSESHVIIAHLAENDVRADITFWERASGIEKLRVELEKERNAPVTTNDLIEALKAGGMPRSSKYVQTALFATKHLGPIGPWVEARAAQDELAPAHRALSRLAADLGALSETVAAALRDVLSDIGDMLAVKTKEASEADSPTAVTLDALSLVDRWHQVIAALLETTPDGLRRMLEAQAQSPRISAEALRAISRGEGVALPQSRGSLPPPPKGEGAAFGLVAAAASPGAPAAAPASQLPLRPALLSPVTPAGLHAGSASPGDAQLPAVEMPPDIPPNLAAAGTAGLAQHEFLKVMTQLTALLELDDCVGVWLRMPLGYLMEPPLHGFAVTSSGVPVQDPYLRRCAWLFLASLSGQHDQRAVAHLPPESGWRRLADEGQTGQYMAMALADAQTAWPSRQAVYAPYVADVLLHPQLGPLAASLIGLAHKLMHETPERCLGDLTELLPA